jgi:hypothetical protein
MQERWKENDDLWDDKHISQICKLHFVEKMSTKLIWM